MTETATAPKQRPYSSIGDKSLAIASTDPRMVRWGINPGSRDCNPPIRDTGISPLPVGHPFPITTFKKQIENCTTDENAPRTLDVTVPAEEAETAIALYLRGLGFKTFMHGEIDEDKMALYKEALLPSLAEINVKCPQTDEMDLGNRDYCPQCAYDFLVSEDCKARIGEFAKQKDTNFDAREASILRDTFISAYAEYLLTAREQWNGIVRDYETGLQTQIASQQHAVRKNIHEVKPADKQLKLVREFTEAQGQNQNENTMAILSYLEEQSAKRDQQMMAFMAGLLEKVNPPAAEETKKGGK